MRINICQLKKSCGSHIDFNFTERPDAVIPGELAGAFFGDIVVGGRITNTGEGLLAQGSASARFKDVCARCLREVTGRVKVDFSEEFFPGPVRAGEEVYVYKGDFIDLKDLLAELLLAEKPFRTLCSENCKGLCPVCGANLNVRPCGCAFSSVDPRLAVLKNINI
jgi:uncharacterized protein